MIEGRFVRLSETHRPEIRLHVDGNEVAALTGDTVLVALLRHQRHLRHSEFGDGVRAGFCLMGACQDCWVRDERGTRLRACSTYASEGMRLLTNLQDAQWPNNA